MVTSVTLTAISTAVPTALVAPPNRANGQSDNSYQYSDHDQVSKNRRHCHALLSIDSSLSYLMVAAATEVRWRVDSSGW